MIYFWTKYRKDEPIPEDLFGDLKYKDTIYFWIKYHKGEPIPNELKFDGWQTSGHLEKPIHYWI